MTWEGGYGVSAVTQRMESSGGQRSHVKGREWRCEFVSSPNLDRTGGLIWTLEIRSTNMAARRQPPQESYINIF